jgi:hypothetical protein
MTYPNAFSRLRRCARSCRQLFALGLLVALVGAAPARAADALRSIDVQRNGETYVVDAVLFAPVAPKLAFEVLADFDQMSKYVPNVRESRIVNREGNVLLIRQQGVARFGVLSFPYVSERQIELTPPLSIRSTQVQGNMRKLQSLTSVVAEGNGAKILYHAELVPSAIAAGVLSKNFVAHEIEMQFNAFVDEMLRRQ